MPQNKREAESDAQRACDACRSRKVRCDKRSPCSNCKSSGSLCRTTATQHAEPRSRVMISKEYEKKIDRIGDRLASIEKMLQQRNGTTDEIQRESGRATRSPVTDITTSTPASTAGQTATTDQPRSDITPSSQSAMASSVVEHAVGESLIAYQDFELKDALKSLREIVRLTDEAPDSINASACVASMQEVAELPGASEIDRLVQMSQDTLALAWSPGLTVPLLQEKCDSVFKSGTQAGEIRRIYVYGVLAALCEEYASFTSDQSFAQRCKVLSRSFAVQLERVVHDLKLTVPASAEAIVALTSAAVLVEKRNKPHLAHTLSSTAASMVILLGYHRLPKMQGDTEAERQGKLLLFWMAYWNDCSFSVRLGRAPVLRHHEIEVPRLSHGSIIPNSFVDAFNYCTRICAIQCRVVEELYSPLSLEQSVAERQRRASRLTEQAHEAWALREAAPPSVADDMSLAGLYLLMKESDAVMHHSTIALIEYATAPSPSSESPALDAARNALRVNINARRAPGFKTLPDFIWAGHCHWGLPKMPITPFTVVFCHIIGHPSTTKDDLRLLTDFVATLKDLCRFAEGLLKLHRLCDIFTRVATLWVRAKEKESAFACLSHNYQLNQSNDMLNLPQQSNACDDAAFEGLDPGPVVEDINDYLSSIGFAPPPPAETGDVIDYNCFDPTCLSDWYNGNTLLTSLVDKGLLLPE